MNKAFKISPSNKIKLEINKMTITKMLKAITEQRKISDLQYGIFMSKMTALKP